ncbi:MULTISPECIES: hypothetical protein [Amycolatopsis]|uniref:Uncharacterized protein n=1 Tax=Amycolatopsis albidoflavus TaxID=102226 RepID=A0ABW5I4R5_9PSEU
MSADQTGAATARYAIVAVLAGIVVLALLDVVVIWKFHGDTASTVGLIGAVDTPIGVLVSAYFGFKTGSDAGAAGRAAAEQARQTATEHLVSLAGQMAPETAGPALRALGIPSGT